VSAAKQWSGEAVEAALAAQGIALAPGRAERLAPGQQSLVESVAADPLIGTLAFEAEAIGFADALARCKTGPR
jgi:hypothetical protein